MENQKKKLTIAIFSALAFAVIGFLIFWFFVRTPPETPGGAPIFGGLPIIGGPSGPGIGITPQPAGTTPPSPSEGRRLVPITSEPIIGAAIDEKNKKLFYYRLRDGHLMMNSFDGDSEQTLSNLTVLNITKVHWSPSREKAIIAYQDGDTTKQFITEATSTPKVSFLPQGIRSPVWSPDGKSVFWLAPRDNAFALVSADTSGGKQKRLSFETPIPDLSLLPLTSDLLGLLPNTVSFFETPLFLITKTSSAPNIPLVRFGLTAISDTNPKTQHIAYSETSRTGELQSIRTRDFSSGKETSWPIRTLAEKCAFSKDAAILFCAVPRSGTDRGMPEMWYQGKISFADDFYRIDLAANRAEKIFDGADLDAIDLDANEEKSRLFFRDKKTGLLYMLPLE